MTAYRNSQLRLLRQCAFAYEKQYVEELPAAPSAPLDGGRNVHAAAQLFVRRVVEGGSLDVHDIASRSVRGGSAEYADALRVLTRLQEAIGVEFDIQPKNVIGLEETLRMPIALPDGDVVEFFGTPDLVERVSKGVCRIPDWKSQWVAETPDEFYADWQLKRYALLVHHHFPNLHTFHLVKRFIRWENSFVEMTITADDLPMVQHSLAMEIVAEREIRAAGAFEPTPGEWCALCGYHALCPRIREYLDAERDIDVPSIADDDFARQLAADAHVLEQAAAKIKTKLKRYLGGEHPKGYVPLPGGGYYGFGAVSHRDVEHASVVAALAASGVEAPAELANIDLKAFDRLLKKLPETAVQRLEGLVRHSQSAQFRYRKNIPHATPAAATSEPQELFS